jgi:hypothetical protein
MSAVIEFHIKSYVSTAAIGAYVLVKKDGDNVVAAGAGEAPIGVTMTNAAAGTHVPVRLLNGYGTAFMKAGAPISKNAAVRGIAGGQVDDSTNGVVVGFAEEAATATGDIIEVALRGVLPTNQLAGTDQAIATDLASVVALANSMRTALISNGLIKGSV